MKKLLAIILSITMLLSMVVIASAEEPVYSESKRSVYLDGEYIDVNNIVIGDIEYLPIKELCGILGYEIKETSGNNYEITKGENCKNSESANGKAVFTVGEDYVTTYSESGAYANKIETFPSAPITAKIGEEIYISSFYFGRMFELKSRFSEDNKIILLTVNYRKEQSENAPEYAGHIYVKNYGDELEIEVDGQKIPFVNKPFIDSDGRTQVAVRDFCEFLDKDVTWWEDTQTVSISSVSASLIPMDGGGAGGASYWFTIGEKQYRINGTYYDMDTAAQIVNNRTYVPLRYLAEAMKYYVAYNPSSGGILDVGYGYRVLNSYMGLLNEEVCSYYDEWNIDASEELIKEMLGDADNALMKTLKLEINPGLSTVRVNFSKDVNFHNRSVLKIIDKDNNYIITDEDIVSCEVRWLPRPEDGPSAGVVTGVALELKLTEKARADFKEATRKISEYTNNENYIKVIVDGIEVSKPAVVAEIDSDEILISSSNIGDYETYKDYADKINIAKG